MFVHYRNDHLDELYELYHEHGRNDDRPQLICLLTLYLAFLFVTSCAWVFLTLAANLPNSGVTPEVSCAFHVNTRLQFQFQNALETLLAEDNP